LIEIRGEIKEILSLMLNEESICINPKPSIKRKKKALKLNAKLYKIKSSRPIRSVIIGIKSRMTKLNFDQIPKLKP